MSEVGECNECVRLRSESRAAFTRFKEVRDHLDQLAEDHPARALMHTELQKNLGILRVAHLWEDHHRRSVHGRTGA